MHDVVIAGAGPAGGMAALRLAEAGARVLILERHPLPRDKACGGALTILPVVELLGPGIERQVKANAENSRWQLDFGPPVDESHDYGAWMVKRRDFDMHIVERALAAGAVELRDNVGVAHVEELPDRVRVTTRTGETIEARYMVGADGAAGKTAAAIGLARTSRPALALDSDVEVTAAGWEAEGGRMSFNFACIPGGYGWVFPKDGYLSCGVGSWTRAAGLPGHLDAYLARALPAGSIRHEVRRGHPIPMYEGPRRISTQRICLTGDAASLVEPILGEGIRFALASGAVAAEVIAENLAGAEHDDFEHSRRVHERIGAHLERLRRFILPIFLASPQTFFDRFIAGEDSYFALSAELDRRFPSSPPFPAAPAAEAAIR